jgi:tryptophan synthase alpha chain
MTGRIDEAFKNKPIFMPYYPLGYPNVETSIDVIEALAKNGADLIEVGLSFSDPLADGPVIQQATQVALEQGITIKKSLQAIKELRKRGVEIPLILMGYLNPMLAYGLEKFARDAAEAGADGFIVPDLPAEESADFESALLAGANGHSPLPLIRMIAPTSSADRMERVARNAQGFIYLVSVTGITGERKSIAEGLGDLIATLREHTSTRICVGFGIGTPQQAMEVGKMADGVIVGTACVRTIGASSTPVETAKQFAAEFRSALQ